MAEKIIRDPVHDVIAFRTDRAEEMLLFGLLNAAEFQRLRRIRQLGMAALAYPGADHSRYSHSLGVMETARKMLDQLAQGTVIDPRKRLVCLAASLLHDLGHGPLSHVFERVIEIEHETHTREIIEDPDSEVHQLLRNYDSDLPRDVAAILAGSASRLFYDDILSSQLDADRLDYLLRDNLMTGSQYGDYDLPWLLHALCVDPGTGRLAVTWKGVSAVEAYLQSRYHMYRNVYFHKTVRSAEGMVKLALQRAKRLAVQERLDWPPRDHLISCALTGQRLSVEQFLELDDLSVLHCFKQWASADDVLLAGLCRGLLYRKLFKTIDLSHLDEEAARQSSEVARHTIAAAGGDADYKLFLDQPADTPYASYESDATGEIRVVGPSGGTESLSALSPLSQALNRQLTFRRLHVAPAWRDRVAKALGLS